MNRFGVWDLLVLSLLLAIVLLVFAPALAEPGKLLYGKDVYDQNSNYELFNRYALSLGQLPLWNPYIFSGFPALADLTTRLLYPPDVLLRALPLNLFFLVGHIFHFWLMAVGGYLLCQQLALSRAAGLIAALGVTLTPAITQLIFFGHLNVISSYAWLPLAFVFAIRSVQRGSLLPHPGLVFILLMQLLAGFPQGILYSFGCIAVYYCYSVFWPPSAVASCSERVRPLLQLAFLVLLFVGVSSFQLFPTFQLVVESGRSEGVSWGSATKGSLAVAELLTMFFPYAFAEPRDVNVPYVGWLLVTLAPLALGSRRHRRAAVFFTVLGLGALALACARDLPFYALVYAILPGLRLPTRFLFIWCLSAGVLGAIGFEVLRSYARTRTRAAKVTTGYLLSVALGLAMLTVFGPRADGAASWAELQVFGTALWVLVLHAIGFTVLAAAAFKHRALVFVAIGMVFVDLYPLSRPMITVDLPHRYEAVAEALDGLDVGRVIDLCEERIPPNRFMDMRVPTTDGYNSLFLGGYGRFLELVSGKTPSEPFEFPGNLNSRGHMPPRVDLLRFMNVTHVVSCSPVTSRHLRFLRTFKRAVPGARLESYVYEHRRRSPRAFWTCSSDLWMSRKQAIELLAVSPYGGPHGPATEVDSSGSANIEVPLQASASFQGNDAATDPSLMVGLHRCEWSDIEADVKVLSKDTPSGDLVLDVVAPSKGLVFISEAYYPEREVWVDGVKSDLARANLAFSAVEVEPGRHRLEVRYVPQSLYLGLAVTGLTLALWVRFAPVAHRWDRRARQRRFSGSQTDGPGPDAFSRSSGPESVELRPRAKLRRLQRGTLVKGALIALACGVATFFVGLVFFAGTAAVGPTIHVRWDPGISKQQRGMSEQELGLERGILIDEGTWAYQIREPKPSDLRAIIINEFVDDTHGFDRGSLEPPRSPPQGPVKQLAFLLSVFATAAAGIVLLGRWLLGSRRYHAQQKHQRT